MNRQVRFKVTKMPTWLSSAVLVQTQNCSPDIKENKREKTVYIMHINIYVYLLFVVLHKAAVSVQCAHA